jgi:hypothetical protein
VPDTCAQHQILQTPTLLSAARIQNLCCERAILQNEIPAVTEEVNQRSDPEPGATVEACGLVGVALLVSAEPSNCECVYVRPVFRQNLYVSSGSQVSSFIPSTPVSYLDVHQLF